MKIIENESGLNNNGLLPEKYTLLIVDDLEVNRRMLKSILSDEYYIEEAKNGLEALEIIRDHGEKISLIISDNHMEKMDGLELLEYLSANPWLKKIPVIMMSSDKTQEFVDQAYALGAADFFFMPFVPTIVKYRIQYTLENAQRHKEELLNSVHCIGEFYYALMLVNLEKDTCEIVDTSEHRNMWDKEIGLCASETIKLFTTYGYIHPDDLQGFLEFTQPKQLQKKFLTGEIKTHLRYRRYYRGNYRWALLEITRAQDYSPEHQVVVMYSRDIQEEVDSQNKTIDVIASRAVATDYCNITRNYFYHDKRANYLNTEMKEMDTITEMLAWGAGQIQDSEIREQYLKLFSRESLIERFHRGEKNAFFEYPYRSVEKGLLLLRTSVQMFQNIHTKDIEGIYYVEDIGKEFVHKQLAENVFYHDYIFVGVWDTRYGDIYIHKTAENLFDGDGKHRIPYQNLIDYRIDRQTLPIEQYLEKISPESIIRKLDTEEEYSFVLDTASEDARPCTLEYIYSYFMRKNNVVALMVRDITEEVEKDHLTQGMNHKGFIRKSEWFLSQHCKKDYTVLYFDIQDFKAINELLGFEAGNKILGFVGEMLRESELHPIYTARVMADQFVCLVQRSLISEAILSDICRTEIKDHKLPIVLRMHCGIYEINESDTNVRSMCDKAKMAMHKIENEFTNPYSWFKQDMNKHYLNQLQVVNNINEALANREFVVYYQPIYNARTRQLASAEALVRWQGRDKEYIYPNVFIPVLEEKGIISQLDLYVATAVHDFIQQQKEQGLSYVPVSINLSQMDFYNKQMLGEVLHMLEHTQVEQTCFRFEITESSFADVNSLKHEFLNKIHEMGCRILIDDFGTGYSSLSSIAKQRFDILKIDMSFVRQIGENKQTEAVVQSIIDMAHRMGAKTVAEGVETEEHYQFLCNNGCDYIQGYYFSRPLPEDDFRKLLK